MQGHRFVTVICQDLELLSSIDEPLRRCDVTTELLSSLRNWSLASSRESPDLAILDWSCVRLPRDAMTLKDLAEHARGVLVIPPQDGPRASGLPAHVTVLERRSSQELLSRVHQLLGRPRRHFARVPFDGNILVRPQDAEAFIARCCDLGPGGAFIESSCALTPGKRVALHFTPPGGQSSFACDGLVTWQRPARLGKEKRFCNGIQFLFPDRQRLSKILTETSC